MQRYFVDIVDNQVILDDLDVHHIIHVMRMKKGDRLELVNDHKLHIGEIENIFPLNIKIVSSIDSDVELSIPVTLIFALSKGNKNDLVIQKATELGANKIIFVPTKRSIVKIDSDNALKKISRYQKIAKEASEQSRRLNIPQIILINSIDNLPIEDINFLAYENEAGTTKDCFKDIKNKKSISIFIGPEGGFDPQEVTLLIKKGFVKISLGKRILRCETAAVYALSVISYLLEK